jgi:hypothetical protein
VQHARVEFVRALRRGGLQELAGRDPEVTPPE